MLLAERLFFLSWFLFLGLMASASLFSNGCRSKWGAEDLDSTGDNGLSRPQPRPADEKFFFKQEVFLDLAGPVCVFIVSSEYPMTYNDV